MDTALEEIEFLALSENRVEVLDLLSGGAYTRHELESEVGASQPTLGRVLRDLSDRRWITREGNRYEATATGEMVAEGFTDLVEILETERRLREVIEWLPTDEMTFDVRHLANATITRPSQTRPNAPVKRVLDLLGDADDVRIISHAFNEESLEVIRKRTVDGNQTFRGVFSPSAVDAIAHDSALRRRLESLLVSESAEIRIYDGEIPLAVTIVDESVHLLLRDDDGLLRAALDTDDPAVVSWATGVHDRYWRDASSLDATALDP